jgi:hypothetical protein
MQRENFSRINDLTARLHLKKNVAKKGVSGKAVIEIRHVCHYYQMFFRAADSDIKELRAVVIRVITLEKPADEVPAADAFGNIKDNRRLFVALIAVDRPGLNDPATEAFVVKETPDELGLRCIRRANAKGGDIRYVT